MGKENKGDVGWQGDDEKKRVGKEDGQLESNREGEQKP